MRETPTPAGAAPPIPWARLAPRWIPALARLRRIREQVRHAADPYTLAEQALRALKVEVLTEHSAEQIPASGAVIVTANHPFGGLDGLAAIAIVGRRRRDLRILANAQLARLEELSPLVIPVDPFGGPQAVRANGRGVRAALRWLASGGALLLFPAGEVSHLRLESGTVTDPPWSATAARLVRRAGVRVMPMFISGSNSTLFQIAGLVHPRLRTALLPNELANKAGMRVELRIGSAISPERCRRIGSDSHLAAFLRLSAYRLQPGYAPCRTHTALPEPTAPPIETGVLRREIAALSPDSLLASAGSLRVHLATARQIPQTLLELGRAREITFRAAGEGTGRARDLDRFDAQYEHLILWDEPAGRIAGAYRLARTDVISRTLGREGLYSSTLFDYGALFLRLLGPALELGRSFVGLDYQKSFAALMLLWKGIAEYVGRNPRYTRLIGPVSVSSDYQPLTRELLVAFLRARGYDPLAAGIRAKRPFRSRLSLRTLGLDPRCARGIDGLSEVIAGLEPDGKGVPVLLRHYLRLGGRMLAFNIDAAFADAIDCLILVDLRSVGPKVLRRYMSPPAWEAFSRCHCRRAACTPADQAA